MSTSETFFVGILRFTVLLSKFLFSLLLIKYLALAEFGQWTFILGIVTYGIFLIGAETYNVLLRKFVRESFSKMEKHIANQWIFFLVQYVILIILSVFLAIYHNHMILTIVLVGFIVILEHATHEFHRLAIYVDDQVHANIILLLKSALWMMLFYLCFAAELIQFTIETVLIFWLLGAVIALLYSVTVYHWFLRQIRLYNSCFDKKIIKLYIRQVAPFFVLSLSIQTPLFLSRYILEITGQREELAIFGYFSTFGNGVEAMFGAIIIAKLIPQLMKIKPGDFDAKYKITETIKSYLIIALVFWIGSYTCLITILPKINSLIEKQALQDYNYIVSIIFLGQMFFSCGTIIQFGLYALDKDKELAILALKYLLISAALLLMLAPIYGSVGAATAMCISSFLIFLGRMRQLLD